MKKIILAILLLPLSIYAQQFEVVRSISRSGCDLNFYNSASTKVWSLNLNELSFWNKSDGSYVLKDNKQQVNVSSLLISPSFTTLSSFLNLAKDSCLSSASVTIPQPLKVSDSLTHVLLADTILTKVTNDSIRVHVLNAVQSDTSYYLTLKQIRDSVSSQTIQLSALLSKLDTTQKDTSSINYIAQFDRNNDTLSAILNTLNLIYKNDTTPIKDTLCFPDPLKVSDSITHVRLDTLIDRISTQKDTNTLLYTYCYRAVSNGGGFNIGDYIEYLVIIKTGGDYLYNSVYFAAYENKTTGTTIFQKDVDGVITGLIPSLGSEIVSCEDYNSTQDELHHQNIIDAINQQTLDLNNNDPIECTGLNETYYINGTNNVFINGSEACSYTLTVLEGEVSFEENGIPSPFNLGVGFTKTNSFRNGRNYLQNSVSITGANVNSKAIITVIK